jgi:hypothetical protein
MGARPSRKKRVERTGPGAVIPRFVSVISRLTVEYPLYVVQVVVETQVDVLAAISHHPMDFLLDR